MNNPADVIRKFIDDRAEVASKATPDGWTAHDNHGVRYVSNGKDGKFAKFDNRICEAPTNLFLRGEDQASNMDFIADARNSASKWEAIAREMLGALDHIERCTRNSSRIGGTDPVECLTCEEVNANAHEALSKCARILSGETG